MEEQSTPPKRFQFPASNRGRKRVIKFALFAIVATALFPFVVMLLWNHVVPMIFGWHSITYFQALWLFGLCRILFGSFRGHYPGGRQQSRWLLERWASMTPEEREKFKEGIRSGCRPGSEATGNS